MDKCKIELEAYVQCSVGVCSVKGNEMQHYLYTIWLMKSG